MKLVIASNNKHKIEEIKEIMDKYAIKVLSLADMNVDIDVEETGTTFKENAFIKARTINKLLNMPVIGDDSGLEVVALNNEPGVKSARYASNHDDKLNRDKVLFEMEGIINRDARFVCGMALVINEEEEYYVEGYLEGKVTTKAVGKNGFGYDSILYLEKYNETAAQISSSLKNQISHRANALKQLEVIIKELNYAD